MPGAPAERPVRCNAEIMWLEISCSAVRLRSQLDLACIGIVQKFWYKRALSMHIAPLAGAETVALSCCRIRKCWLNGADVALIGPKLELTYPYQHAGEGASALADALSGGAGGLLVSSIPQLCFNICEPASQC